MGWETLWNFFSRLEMSMTLSIRLHCFPKFPSKGAMCWAIRLTVLKKSEATLRSMAPYVPFPPQSNVSNPWDCDWWLYKERHLVECFFQKLKWFLRVATRYDKRDDSFLAFVHLASISILVK
jgi:hypothetical protein